MAYAPSPSSGPAATALSKSSAAWKTAAAPSNAPQGTFLPGTKVQVGSQRVVIEKYLSEGGFAHVYVVRVPRDNNKHELAVLKRVAVPDREHLTSMRTEVETMKKVQGHKHVVKYMDSHASQLKGGGYEVFLLMEYCSGGGLIDFMNTRLQHRLTEPEILKIFGDVAEGVACMHYLKPPLLHRDLKVENVLISKSAISGSPVYKLCDFGSAALPRPAAKTPEEGRLIEEDVQQHTTMQYRSPEMIDVWRQQPIDEKADIWALGVFLYKLCYYTTPFENAGQMAILNASFKYPTYPSFSERLKKLIGIMLKENPKDRPNVYQVIKEVSAMRGTEVPIKDIYAQRTQSEARRNESLPKSDPVASVGLQKPAPKAQVQAVPDIAPMRRGRPTTSMQQAPLAAIKPGLSPARGDPFAALDSKNYDVRSGAVEELSKIYPSLDDFSITHDKGGIFAVPSNATLPKSDAIPAARPNRLSERVTAALADEAFKQPAALADIPKSNSVSHTDSHSRPAAVKAAIRDISKNEAAIHQNALPYTSTGTGSSPPSSAVKTQAPVISKRPIWKVPDVSRSSSQPRASATAKAAASMLQPTPPSTLRPAVVDLHRSKSQTTTLNTSNAPIATSSRPSLEGHRPSLGDLGDSITRTRSANSRQRPASAYVSSDMDYLRDQEHHSKRPSVIRRRSSRDPAQDSESAVEDAIIIDDIDYLRQSEDVDRRPSHRHSLHKTQGHRSSGSMSNAKNALIGRFGDAFKRFERRSSDNEPAAESSAPALVPSSNQQQDETRLLSPILGSETGPSARSDNDSAIDETEALPPNVRRELERRELREEEQRVASAAAEYRSRAGAQGTGPASSGPTRASTIQKRVQSLLDEASQSSIPTQRTAEGYGRYTDQADNRGVVPPSASTGQSMSKAVPPQLARKPILTTNNPGNVYPRTRQQPSDVTPTPVPIPSASAPPTAPVTAASRVASRPSVPPKAPSLRTGGDSTRSQWPPPPQPEVQPSPSSKPAGGLAALLAKDLEGVPEYPPRVSSARGAPVNGLAMNDDSAETEFSKRYPSLSGIEMVETEIAGERRVMRVREV